MAYGVDQFNEELMHYGVLGMKWGVRKDRRYTDKEISEYRKRKIAEAPTKSESPRGANKGWYKNAPKSVLIREMRREESEASKMNKKAKKRISKQYAKEQAKGDEDLKKSYDRMYVDAYNKAADKMNGGGIDRYNRAQEKKYGKDYAKRSGYENDYIKMFNKEVSKILSKSMYEFTKSNSHYKKATELVKKYDMLSWDELAKSNSEGINAVRKQFEKK